jgi:hypothetical protein
VNDVSNGDFTILAPSIEVLSPNGGESLQAGCDYEITWDSTNITGTVFIEYSKDNFGSDVNLISSGETDDGSYLWTNIPLDISSTVRVRVSSTNSPSVNDISDAEFSILSETGRALTWGGTSGEISFGTTVDASGNIYVAGSFRGTVDFDPGNGTDSKTSNGGTDAFLSKFNSCGDLEWVGTWGGVSDDLGYKVSVDGSGNPYVVGHFVSSVDFDPGTGIEIHSSNGEDDVFLSRFNSSGVHQWAVTWGGAIDDTVGGFGLDSSGYPYVMGTFGITCDFDPGSGNVSRTSNGESDIYVSKFDPAGTFQWVSVWGGSSGDAGLGFAVDSSGVSYISGYYKGSVDFDPGAGSTSFSSSGSWFPDAYLSSLDSSGGFRWARSWGGMNGLETGTAIALDGSGNVYVAGYFQDIVDLDPTGGVDTHASSGDNDISLCRFTSTGAYTWGRSWGGSSADIASGISVTSGGTAFVTGWFSGTADFDPGGGSANRSSNGGQDGFLNVINSSGTYVRTHVVGGTGNDACYGIKVDSSQASYLVGKFEGTVEFAPVSAPCNNASDQRTSAGSSDAYLIMYLPSGCW